MRGHVKALRLAGAFLIFLASSGAGWVDLASSEEEPLRAMGSSVSENPGVREAGTHAEAWVASSPSSKEGGDGQPAVAMWVWDARIALSPEARKALFSFCRRHRVGTLYLSAYNLTPPLDSGYREFNRQAHRQGIKIHALAGDPRWGQPRYHAIPLQWTESVRKLNTQGHPEEGFDGIHTDVEVYLLSKSWNEDPGRLLGGYLDLNAKISELLQSSSPRLAFGVDIPFWFDDDPSYRILWKGKVKPPSFHVLDTVDTVTVMAYRNFAEGPDGTIRLVLLEMNYADEVGKRVVIGQETQEDLFPKYVTFGGTSCAKFQRELKKIEKAYGSRPSFGGFAVHHYESFRKLCSD